MSVEITLYTKTATKTGLIRLLSSNNFQRARHFMDEMNTPEMIGFMWFGFDNYESSTGVEATIIKASVDDKKKYNCSDWILHTRTRSSGTFEDKQKQNEIIRTAKRQFGGAFYNDWYGKNRYTNLEDYKKFTPLEKGISIIASNSLEKLGQITNCLNGYRNEMSETIAKVTPESFRYLLVTKDPSTILYNSLMPFLVSVLEYFFSQCFINYIKYNEQAKQSLTDEKIKIDISQVIGILDKENSLEQIVAQLYNFQNIDSINKAFKKYLSIDVKLVLSQRKKINGNIVGLLTKIQEILQVRHRFVHELDINYSLSKQMFLDHVLVVENTIKAMLVAFKTKGLTIEIDH